MKLKHFLLSLLVVLISASSLMAGEADDFKIDKAQVQHEFADLYRLEQTVVDHNFMTLSQMENSNLLTAEFASMNLSSNMMMESALGIPGFWWGCIFGPLGILVVYLVSDNDRAEVKSAFTGCIVGSAVSAVLYLIYALAIVSTY
jgi:prepilin signal peptidase PulO-like enzyme (type II secretory pathway)